MKKPFYLIIPTILLLVTCKNAPTEPTFDGTFSDYTFEELIRYTLNKPNGYISQSDLNTITKIDGDGWGGVSIKDIKYCENLTSLSLRDNFLYHPQPYSVTEDQGVNEVNTLENLEYLDLSGNYISNLTFVRNCENIKTLFLENTRISDIRILKNLQKLEHLRISDRTLRYCEVFYDLPNLKYLYLEKQSYNYKLYDYLGQATNLIRLSMVSCNIQNITFLEDLTSLRNLNLGDNKIKNIEILKNFKNLAVLYLHNNRIIDLKPLVENSEYKAKENLEPYLLLTNNPLSEQSINEYIPALEARGVTVYY